MTTSVGRLRLPPSPATLVILVLLAAVNQASLEAVDPLNHGSPVGGIVSDHVVVAPVTSKPKSPDAEAASRPIESVISTKEIELPRVAADVAVGGKGLKTPLTELAVKIVLGGRCSGDQDCAAMNYSRCSDGLCSCRPGYVPSKHGLDKCLKVPSGLGDACEEEAQCEHAVANSDCSPAGVCECPLGYVFDANAPRCWLKQAVGGACNVSAQCADVASADCSQGVCACRPPLVPAPSNSKCLSPAGSEYAAICEEDIQCTVSYGDEARCSHGQCRCVNAYHYNGSKCLPDLPLGAACGSDVECAVSEPEGEGGASSRSCLGAVCACSPGRSPLPGEDACGPPSFPIIPIMDGVGSGGGDVSSYFDFMESMQFNAAQELAVTFTWLVCILVAKYLS